MASGAKTPISERALLSLKNLLSRLSDEERDLLSAWMDELIQIRELEATKTEKLSRIKASLRRSKALVPVIKELALLTKEQAWDERKGGWRWMLSGIGVGILFFGFQGVGLAALGGAIGFPLFIVFGAGGAIAYTIKSEIDAYKKSKD